MAFPPTESSIFSRIVKAYVWVSTYGGLDRFRELPVVSLSAKQGLSGDSVSSVLAARDGSIWLSGRNGLDRWENGQVKTFRKAQGLPDDGPHSLFQDNSGRIWAFSPHGCAYFEDGRFVAARDVPGGYMPAIAGDADNL
jgi:ligand-binding sensor domain-containing protein